MTILIVGLGNPGKQYEKTRHNAGFLALDHLATALQATNWKLDKQARAEIVETRHNDHKLVLAKPQTFMNLSGESIASLCGKYSVTSENVWVISDDTALPLGTVRVRVGGSAGGHNGLKSVIEHIGEKFARFRIGVGPQPTTIPLEAFVLQKFGKEEIPVLEESVKVTTAAIMNGLDQGIKETSFT